MSCQPPALALDRSRQTWRPGRLDAHRSDRDQDNAQIAANGRGTTDVPGFGSERLEAPGPECLTMKEVT